MNFVEVKGDIFRPEIWYNGNLNELYLAHCIASDFGMYGGIARQFVDKMNMREKLYWYADMNLLDKIVLERYDNGGRANVIPSMVGNAILIEEDRVFNLITKLRTSQRPDLNDFVHSLWDMRIQMLNNGVKYLAIPDMIGCGIDGLSRNVVLDELKRALYGMPGTLYIVKYVP